MTRGGLIKLIKLLIAGPREFTDECNRQAERSAGEVRVIGIATEPSTAVESLEKHASGADAILLGFPDEKISIFIDVINRHAVTATTFISVENLAVGYKKWTPFRFKCTRRNQEIQTIITYFRSKPELLQQPVVPETTLQPDREIHDREARIQEVKRREVGNRAVAVKSKVVSIYSQKGGTGKTTIVVSLAQSVSVLSNLRVCILDLDMTRNYSDVARYLSYVGEKKADINVTLAAWDKFPWEEKNIWSTVESMVMPIRNGLYILPALRTVSEEQNITTSLVKRSIEVLRRHFDLLLIDLGNLLGEAALAAASVCDEVLIVDCPDLPIVDSLKDFLDSTLQYTGIDRSQVGIIMNREIPELKFKITEITSYLKLPIMASFPEDSSVRVMLANESRVPYLGGNSSPFVQEMEKVMYHLFPREAFDTQSAQSKSGGIMNFFRKLRRLGGAKG